MNLLWRTVGRNKDPTPNEALAIIKGTMQKVDRSITDFDARAEAQRETAKKDIRTNRRAAATALRRSKMYSAQAAKLSNMHTTLETLCLNIESAILSKDIVDAIQTGNTALNQAGAVDLEKVDDVMDNVIEAMDSVRAITEALSMPVNMPEIDDAELEQELNELQGLDLEERFASVVPRTSALLPVVRKTKTFPKKNVPEDVEDDLKME